MEINLSTRKNNHISNYQESGELPLLELANNADNMSTYINCRYRTDPCGYYNCHGLTFASRRTKIWEANVIRKIIFEDDYEIINIKDVFPGDLILYSTNLGAITHSGIVLSIDSIGSEIIPKILSKWGTGSEVVHNYNNCPYWKTAIIITFYRIKSIQHRGVHVD